MSDSAALLLFLSIFALLLGFDHPYLAGAWVLCVAAYIFKGEFMNTVTVRERDAIRAHALSIVRLGADGSIANAEACIDILIETWNISHPRAKAMIYKAARIMRHPIRRKGG